ncbi:unnamed protein product [Schistosoma mattheei]|uniref:Heparan-sulfate 6-O-sulfotransferase n=1 Tax=Schistosoma mattheei TaxID=31246 RepID=A0A183PNG3_9TREM|nr:unnamed protein product [Schistosoma mattheei]
MKEDKLFCICGLIVGIVLLFYVLSPYSPTCLLRSCIHNQNDRTGFLYAVSTTKTTKHLMAYTRDNSSNVSVLVFIHIQKTAGTLLERRLVKDGLVGKTCYCFFRRRCNCKTPSGDTWLVSRYSTGWVCGLHADLTELTECIDSKLNKVDHHIIKRRYIYFTLLRDPVDRFISEWQHIRRGATWHSATLRCNKQYPPLEHYKPCYFNEEIVENIPSNVSIKSVIDCPYNLASNRQTRMLANLSILGCYKHLTKWSQPLNATVLTHIPRVSLALLNSAKHNLVSIISCYGLSEYLIYSQYILQKCLHITFKRSFIEFNKISFMKQRLLFTHATIIRSNLNQSTLREIQNVNRLDIFLYSFAKQLFVYRLVNYLLFDSNIPLHFRRPLHTVWHNRPRSKSYIGLSYLLFSNPIINYHDANISSNAFSYRFNLFLTNLFIRKGSIPVSESILTSENKKWSDRLSYDFKI